MGSQGRVVSRRRVIAGMLVTAGIVLIITFAVRELWVGISGEASVRGSSPDSRATIGAGQRPESNPISVDGFDLESVVGERRMTSGSTEETAHWREFVRAVQSKQFDLAIQMLPVVKHYPIDVRAEVIRRVGHQPLGRQEARQCLELLRGLLFGDGHPVERSRVRDVVIECWAEHWSSVEQLRDERKERYESVVLGKPLSTPERAGLTNVDVLLAGLYLDAAAGAPDVPSYPANSLIAVGELLSVAENRQANARPFYEPLISALLNMVLTTGVQGMGAVCEPHRHSSGLSERLRWELAALASSDSNLWSRLATIESTTDMNDRAALVRALIRSGLTGDEMVNQVLPWLETRVGAFVASGWVRVAVQSIEDPDRLNSWADCATLAFIESEPGSGLATLQFDLFASCYFAGNKSHLSGREMREPPEPFNVVASIAPKLKARFGRALVAHWGASTRSASTKQMPVNTPAWVCLAAVEASEGLSDAVAMLESIVGAIALERELDRLRNGFDAVIRVVRVKYSAELDLGGDLRQRLYAVADRVLSTEPRRTGSIQIQRSSAFNTVKLADQLMAVADRRSGIQPSIQARRSLGSALQVIEDLVAETPRRDARRSILGQYAGAESAWLRVRERLRSDDTWNTAE